ncbi:MAG TPA: 4-hydroxy-tetrahydrodipicolinate reductase [Usitatibacteraceae bacterium]|nr:4-hydroxy-tetrahydrodipicolinate reductase [Usitatibacteraceae bacterium]
MGTVRLAIAGGGGRMGRALIDAAASSGDLHVACILEHPASRLVGKDAGELSVHCRGLPIRADVAAAIPDADVLIDFTRPEGTLAHLAACRAAGVRMVIGTTGFSDAQLEAIADASRDIAIVRAGNMSIGVNVTLKLVEQATRALQGYDIEIIEAHHKMKVDAPSGTALMLGDAAATALGCSLAEITAPVRQGHTGERKAGSIGFSSIRAGDIVGEHTVLFAGDGERVEIRHVATSRGNFAKGALAAARFLVGKPSGLFDMRDVLELN